MLASWLFKMWWSWKKINQFFVFTNLIILAEQQIQKPASQICCVLLILVIFKFWTVHQHLLMLSCHLLVTISWTYAAFCSSLILCFKLELVFLLLFDFSVHWIFHVVVPVTDSVELINGPGWASESYRTLEKNFFVVLHRNAFLSCVRRLVDFSAQWPSGNEWFTFSLIA